MLKDVASWCAPSSCDTGTRRQNEKRGKVALAAASVLTLLVNLRGRVRRGNIKYVMCNVPTDSSIY